MTVSYTHLDVYKRQELPEFAVDEAIRRIADIKEFVETVKKNTAQGQ